MEGADGGVLNVLEIKNTSATATSPLLLRRGFPWRKGDVPAGSLPKPHVVTGAGPVYAAGVALATHQWDERSTWGDGSLKFAVLSLAGPDLAASETIKIGFRVEPGAYPSTTSRSLSTITANTAFSVALTGRTETDNSTTSGTLPDLAAVLNTHAMTDSRRTVTRKGPACYGEMIWGMYGAHEHLKVYWHVEVWDDGAGGIAGYRCVPVTSQDWWRNPFGTGGKKRQNYTAAFKNGGSTLGAYSSVQHIYNAQWAALRPDDDDHHAEPFWVAGTKTRPTLHVVLPSSTRSYWIASKIMPPLKHDSCPAPASPWNANTYAPMAAVNHRKDITGVGEYYGRGAVSKGEAWHFANQTKEAARQVRADACTGFSYPVHLRSPRTRNRPAAMSPTGSTETGSDIASTIIAIPLGPAGALQGDFTTDGMPISVKAACDKLTGNRYSAVQSDSYEVPTGGLNNWFVAGDSAHDVNYTFYQYLNTGERWWLEASYDVLMWQQHQKVGDEGIPHYSATGRKLNYYQDVNRAADTGRTFDTRTWYGTGDICMCNGNARNGAWYTAILGMVVGLTPDGQPETNFFRAMADQSAAFAAAHLYTLPQNQIDSGMVAFQDGYHDPMQESAPWHTMFYGVGAYLAYRLLDDSRFKDLGDVVANYLIANWATSPQKLYYYVIYPGTLASGTAWHPTTNPFRAPTRVYHYGPMGGYDAAANTITHSGDLTNGDEVLGFNGPQEALSGLMNGQIYYVVNRTSTTAQLSATPGGSPVDFSVQRASGWIAVDRQGDRDGTIPRPGYVGNGGSDPSYMLVAYAGLVEAYLAGKAGLTASAVDAAKALVEAHHAFNAAETWRYDRSA